MLLVGFIGRFVSPSFVIALAKQQLEGVVVSTLVEGGDSGVIVYCGAGLPAAPVRPTGRMMQRVHEAAGAGTQSGTDASAIKGSDRRRLRLLDNFAGTCSKRDFWHAFERCIVALAIQACTGNTCTSGGPISQEGLIGINNMMLHCESKLSACLLVLHAVSAQLCGARAQA